MTRGKWKLIDFNKYGNTQAVKLYSEILQEKIDLGGKNEISIHRNIEVFENHDSVTPLFRLTEEVLWPKSEYLDVKVSNADDKLLIVSLRQPENVPSLLKDCPDLKSYKNFLKGVNGNTHNPHMYPKTHLKDYR